MFVGELFELKREWNTRCFVSAKSHTSTKTRTVHVHESGSKRN